eukprot:1179786-Prorocentrum_minimum.AAC.6
MQAATVRFEVQSAGGGRKRERDQGRVYAAQFPMQDPETGAREIPFYRDDGKQAGVLRVAVSELVKSAPRTNNQSTRSA